MAPRGPTSLASPSTRFVGRTADRERLEELLAAGTRVITLWGPAGMGKTRLAAHLVDRAGIGGRPAAERERGRRGSAGRAKTKARSTAFCELADVRDAPALAAAVARSLAVPLRTRGRDELAQLGDALARRGPMLLVLDNVEQIVEPVAEAVGRWLRVAPEVQFLVTSRDRLRIGDEVCHELAPLSLPERGLEGSEAVELFLDRARAIVPGWSVPPGEDDRLVELVRGLEGIPLILELAAGHVDVLGVAGLVERLPRRLELLASGRRDHDARQATLRGAIAWSWDLLDDVEQSALAECSVFRGGFTVEAAAAVVDGRGRDITLVLRSLRDKSLLRSRREVAGVRLDLFESIREFAADKLGEAAAARAQQRHATYYLAAAGRPGVAAVELANLLAIAERGRAAVGAAAALDALLAADDVVAAQGPFAFHVALLDEAIARARAADVGPAALVRALAARGRAHQVAGHLAAALADLDAALGLARQHRDPAQGDLCTDLGVVHHQLRDVERARAFYDEALAMQRAAGDRRAEGRTLGNLGALLHDVQQLDAALANYEAALAIFQAVGDARLEGLFHNNAGILEQERGRRGHARERYARALSLLDGLRDRRLGAIARGNLGLLEHEEGALDAARACHEGALAELVAVGDVRSEALCRSRLAATLADLGAVDDARAQAEAAERRAAPLGDRVALEAVLLNGAFLRLAEARAARARGDEAASRGAVERLRERMSAVVAPGPGGERSVAELCDDVRASLRVLERHVAELEAGPPPDALSVHRQGEWLKAPGADATDLRAHKATRRLLVRLARARHEAPGRGLSLAELREAGWPGEAMGEQAAENRVQVALAQLRKGGLKRWLLKTDDGWLIDPAVPLCWVAGPLPQARSDRDGAPEREPS